MKAYVRRKIAEITGSELTDVILADLFSSGTFLFEEFTWSALFDGLYSPFQYTGFTADALQVDIPGNTGAYGALQLGTDPTDPVASAGFLAQQTTFGFDSTLSQQSIGRMRVLEIRARPPGLKTASVAALTRLASCNIVIGAFKTTLAADLTPAVANPTPIKVGLYFSLVTDANAAGNWMAVATTNASGTPVSTTIDTKIAPHVNMALDVNNVLVAFQTFRIEFDGTTASFFIRTIDETGVVVNDGQTAVVVIETNVPASTELVAGFGAIVQNRTAVGRTLGIDNLLMLGEREFNG